MEGTGLRPDACAWYRPLHYHGLGWGIFVREDCLLRIALEIAPYCPRPHSSWQTYQLAKALIRAAFSALFLHEQYHHKTESFALRLHVVERTGRYVPYHQGVYLPSRGTDDLLEEALANADSYHRLRTDPYRRMIGETVLAATTRYLEDEFPRQSPGYRKAVDLLDPVDFGRRENLLKSQVQEAAMVPFRPASDWDVAPRINQSYFSCRSDIWTVVRPGAARVLPTSHPYPAVPTRAVTKALGRIGYQPTAGGKGSHLKLVADGLPTLVLPGNEKDLSPVVLRSIAKALGFKNADDLTGGLDL